MLGNTIWLNNVLVADNQDGSGHGQIEVLGGTAYLKHVTLATAGLNPAAGLVTRGGTAIINNTIVASQTIGLKVEAGSLSGDEIQRLHRAIRQVLQKALRKKGASVRNYIRPDGQPGTAHDEFNVAHGVGKNCPRCGTPIQRIVVRGRGTYLCPHCQPEP